MVNKLKNLTTQLNEIVSDYNKAFKEKKFDLMQSLIEIKAIERAYEQEKAIIQYSCETLWHKDIKKDKGREKHLKEQNDIAFVIKAFDEYINTLGDTEFEINQIQYDKFYNAVQFLADIAKKCGGEMEPVVINPFMISGGATATFDVLSLWGDDIPKLQSIIGDITALDIDIQKDKVCISFCIPDVFIEKIKS